MIERKIENGIPYRWEEKWGVWLPDLRAEEAKPEVIGRFGRARLAYLREKNPEEEERMILDGTLNETLAMLDRKVWERIEQLEKELLEKNPAPDKIQHQLEWVAHMNSLREQAIEIATNEMVYV